MRRLLAMSLIGVLSLSPSARGNDSPEMQKLLREIEELRKATDKEKQENRKSFQDLRDAFETYKIQADLKAKEIQSRAEQTRTLQDMLDESRKEVQKLQEQTSDLRLKLATAELERDLVKKNGSTLEKLVAELEKREAKSAPLQEPGPPVRDLRGKISAIADAGLYIVSIGADDGVERDQVLEVYRMADRPIYLGTLTVVRTYARQSVGQYKPNGKERAEVGDEVGTRVFPNK